MKTWALRLWRDWGRPFLLVAVIVFPIRSTIADWYEVPSGSMKPTIVEGDRVFVNKLAYDLKVPFTRWRLAWWDHPERGDVVVFASPADGTRLVKRVVGVPGDLIAMNNNRLYVNDEPVEYENLDEDLVKRLMEAAGPGDQLLREALPGHDHFVMITPGTPAIRSFGPVEIPDGHYFMMGDNRDNSGDSRYFGFVPRERVVGKALAVVLSLNYDRYYMPRWSRFLVAL